jgi:hypothetical protein
MLCKHSLVVLLVLFAYTTAQGKTKDELIKDVFGTNDQNEKASNKQNSRSATWIVRWWWNSGTGSCTCVPYYLCNNGSVNTNGEGVIDIR